MLFDSITLHRFIWHLSLIYFSHIRKAYPSFADEMKAIFIHVPKAAGMSISSALFETEVGHLRLRDYQLADEEKFQRYFKFAFVRNPWDRIVSAYVYLSRGGMPKYRYDLAFKKKVMDPCRSFEQFVMEWVDEKNIYKHAHFVPQYRFVTDKEGHVALDFLGRFETLEEDFQEICGRLGIRREIKTVNVSGHAHYSTYYTNNEMIEKVERIYAKDISLFGYHF